MSGPDRRLPTHIEDVATSVSQLIESRRQSGAGPICIGIGGGSGSGKSTVSGLLTEGLQAVPVESIGLDRFFKPQDLMPTYSSLEHGEDRPDFNHPDSVDRSLMIEQCRAAVDPTRSQPAATVEVVIIEGILALYYPELRELMHLRCYVTVELEEMLDRRMKRNIAAGYGGGPAEIAAYNRECVEPQHRRYNQPTAAMADLLIPNDREATAERDRMIAEVCGSILRLLGRAG